VVLPGETLVEPETTLPSVEVDNAAGGWTTILVHARRQGSSMPENDLQQHGEAGDHSCNGASAAMPDRPANRC